MAITTKQFGHEVLSPDELMDALEEIRYEFTGGVPPRSRRAN